MKKNLLSICMLLLCLCIISSKTFAQLDPGGGGTNVLMITPPSYVLNCKRNNGNGTSAGMAEVRLNFSDNNPHNIMLIDIRNFDGSLLPKGAVVFEGGNSRKRI